MKRWFWINWPLLLIPFVVAVIVGAIVDQSRQIGHCADELGPLMGLTRDTALQVCR